MVVTVMVKKSRHQIAEQHSRNEEGALRKITYSRSRLSEGEVGHE